MWADPVAVPAQARSPPAQDRGSGHILVQLGERRIKPRQAWSCGVAGLGADPHAPDMFAITEAEAAAIRAVYEQSGELSAVVELRRVR